MAFSKNHATFFVAQDSGTVFAYSTTDMANPVKTFQAGKHLSALALDGQGRRLIAVGSQVLAENRRGRSRSEPPAGDLYLFRFGS